MCSHRERGALGTLHNAAEQMDRRGRSERKRGFRVFCDVNAYVSCGGYVGILQRARVLPVKQGGTTDDFSPVLDFYKSGRVFLFLWPYIQFVQNHEEAAL